MRVDKNDRYVSENSYKKSTPLMQLPNFLQNYSKRKLTIMLMAVVIILLLLSLVVFRPSTNNEPTSLTPPVVNGVPPEEPNSVTEQQPNPAIQPPQPVDSQTTNGSSNSAQSHVTQSGGNDNSNNPTQAPNSANGASTSQPTTPPPASPQTTQKPEPVSHKPEINTSTNSAIIKDEHYAVQLSASKSAEGLRKLVKQHNLTNYQIYETKRNNETWYILVQGNYATADEAKKAIKSLPDALQNDKPWIKSGATINKEKTAK